MYQPDNEKNKRILIEYLSTLKPNKKDTKEDGIIKNISYGMTKISLERMKNKNFINKIFQRIKTLSETFYYETPYIDFTFLLSLVDRIYNSGFNDGHFYKKSEELAELILTPPHNRISKN